MPIQKNKIDTEQTRADASSHRVRVMVATVLFTAPEIGVAIVSPIDAIPNDCNTFLAYLPYNSNDDSASPYQAYAIGSCVVCVPLFVGTDIDAYAIIGTVNKSVDMLQSNASARKHYNLDSFLQAYNDAPNPSVSWRVLSKVFDQKLDNKKIQCHMHNADGDSIPGDYDLMVGGYGPGVHFGKYMTTLHASPMAFIDLYSVDNGIRTMSASLSMNTMLQEKVMDSSYAVSNVAINEHEALGVLKEDEPLSEKNGDVDSESVFPKHQDAVPLYRVQSVAGDVAAGRASITVMPSKPEFTQHDQKNPSAVVSLTRQTIAGELQSAGALGVMSAKTPFIAAIQQLGYGDDKTPAEMQIVSDRGKLTNVTDKLDDLRTPYNEVDEVSPEAKEADAAREKASEERRVTDAAINKMIETLLDGDYRDALLKVLASKGFSVAKKDDSLYANFSEHRVIGGVETEQFYGLPDRIEIEDPVTKIKHTYYDTMSFISHEPDGSICLCDGYGSEIRMCRGNIYISPALDLIMRPGRDLSAMVPRHQSFNSQDTCTINCGTDMFVRASKNMKMVSGTDGIGSFIIEGKGAMTTDGAGGIVINSYSCMSVTATRDMYIGRNDNTGNAKAEVTNRTSGTLVIDAGNGGACRVGGRTLSIDSQSTVISCIARGGSGNPTSGSAIILGQKNIGIMTESILAPCDIIVNGISDDPTIPVMTPTGVELARVKTRETPSVQIRGDLRVQRNMQVDGVSKFCGNNKTISIYARGIASTPGTRKTIFSLRNAPSVKGKPETAPFYVNEPTDQDIPESYGATGQTALAGIYATVYQDYYLAVNCFSFPETYSVTLDVMPGMAWQDRAKDAKNTGDPWREKGVVDRDGNETYCYPGTSVWANVKISSRGYNADTDVQGGYVTNTIKTKEIIINGQD